MTNRQILMLFLVLLLIGLVSCLAQPAGRAGAQAVPTVTPLPGPLATLQAAQTKKDQARADKARADDIRRTAEAQGAAADQNLNDAQRDYDAAQAAIVAQQLSAASELIGQGQEKVKSAGAQIDQLLASVNDLQALVKRMAADRESDQSELQQLRAQNQTLQANYDATDHKNKELIAQQQHIDINGGAVVILAIIAGAIVVGLIVFWISRRPTITYTATATVTDPDDYDRDDRAADPEQDADEAGQYHPGG